MKVGPVRLCPGIGQAFSSRWRGDCQFQVGPSDQELGLAQKSYECRGQVISFKLHKRGTGGRKQA